MPPVNRKNPVRAASSESQYSIRCKWVVFILVSDRSALLDWRSTCPLGGSVIALASW